MRLLILTQAVDENNPILGFFIDWIKEFAKNCEFVTVICLQEGSYNLPANVKVLSLGKENGVSQIKYLYRFYKYIWQERKNYDAVFVHMNQIYVILGGWLWRLWYKKIGLWYVHKQVSHSLKLAEKIVDIIFTASAQSFRLKSKKVKVVGHGINPAIFKPAGIEKNSNVFKIITIGRIAPVKNYELLVEAAEFLLNSKLDKKIEVKIIGAPQTTDENTYLEKLKKIVTDKKLEGTVFFPGAIPNKEIVSHLQSADLFVNTSQTGSLDKAVLEAMACETLVVTTNEAFVEIFGDLSDLTVSGNTSTELAEKIKFFIQNNNQGERQKIKKELRCIVLNNHNLDSLISNILKIYGSSTSR